MSRELLPLALTDLKVKSKDGSELVSSLQLVPVSFHGILPMLVESWIVIALELSCFLGR